MQHAVDLHAGDGRALQRGQQDAAQRVAERQAEAALERLGDDGGDAARSRAALDFELVRAGSAPASFFWITFIVS